MMLASIKTKQVAMMSSIEVKKQANADCQKGLQSISAELEEIQLDKTDTSKAYEVQDFAHTHLQIGNAFKEMEEYGGQAMGPCI